MKMTLLCLALCAGLYAGGDNNKDCTPVKPTPPISTPINNTNKNDNSNINNNTNNNKTANNNNNTNNPTSNSSSNSTNTITNNNNPTSNSSSNSTNTNNNTANSSNSSNNNNNSKATSNNANNSNAIINQTFAADAPGQDRQFINPVQPHNAPVINYLGPWNTGVNVLEDFRTLPELITYEQAKLMYKGGVSVRINRLKEGKQEYKTCKLINHLPLKIIKDDDSKEYFVPDETRFDRKAFISLQGDGKATTLDVIAKAVIEALDSGANSILILKKVAATETSTTGWGIGLGAVFGNLGGNDGLTKSQAGSAGTGFNHATAKPIYADGLMVLALYCDEKPDPKPTPPPPPVVVVPTPPVVVPSALKMTIDLKLHENEIFFEVSKYDITKEAKVVIERVAAKLKEHPEAKVIVSGLTSAEGQPAFNVTLSRNRAKSVVNALLDAGVPNSQIVFDKGLTYPKLQSNRRVEITIATLKEEKK